MPCQGLVAGTRPATTLSPVAYISTDFIGCATNGGTMRGTNGGYHEGYQWGYHEGY